MKKRNRLNLNGVVVVDKPKGYSSNKVLQDLKYSFNAQKAGHTGTLDPMATGVLPICFGRATKIAQYLLDADKEYIATIKLGQETDSGDAEGEIIATSTDIPELTAEVVESVLAKFRGKIEQTPPMFSALKVNGQPLYKLARAGEKVEVKSRVINIYELECLDFSKDEIEIRVKSSKGTYIRSLAIDIGSELGCGGHLIKLHRTQSGPFTIGNSFALEELKELSLDEKVATINHVEKVFEDKTIYSLTKEDAAVFVQYGRFPKNELDGVIRVYSEDKLIAIAEFETGKLISKKFFEQEILISE